MVIKPLRVLVLQEMNALCSLCFINIVESGRKKRENAFELA